MPNATSTFNWYGGELAAKVRLGSPGKIATLNLTTDKAGVKLAGVFTSFAWTTWTGDGDIAMDATGGPARFVNGIGATFDIQNNQTIAAVGLAIPTFWNEGNFLESLGSSIAEIQAAFRSSGNIEANSGTLSFTQGVTQTVGGTTTLCGGNISTGTHNFNLLGGNFTGTGTLTGNLVNTSGTVIPGLRGAAGNLNLAGNFVQGAGGELIVNIDASGKIGHLNVGTNGLFGGDADTGGKLAVNRNPAYAPVDDVLRFLNFVTDTSGNDFSTFDFPNNSWNTGRARSFSAVDGTTTYDLWAF